MSTTASRQTPSLEEVRRHVQEMWVAVAGAWEQHADFVEARGAELTRQLLAETEPKPGERVLELASGAGDVGLAVAPLVAPGEVVVSDIAAGMVAIAARRAEPVASPTSQCAPSAPRQSTPTTRRSTSSSAARGSCSRPTRHSRYARSRVCSVPADGRQSRSGGRRRRTHGSGSSSTQSARSSGGRYHRPACRDHSRSPTPGGSERCLSPTASTRSPSVTYLSRSPRRRSTNGGADVCTRGPPDHDPQRAADVGASSSPNDSGRRSARSRPTTAPCSSRGWRYSRPPAAPTRRGGRHDRPPRRYLRPRPLCISRCCWARSQRGRSPITPKRSRARRRPSPGWVRGDLSRLRQRSGMSPERSVSREAQRASIDLRLQHDLL